MYEYTTYAMAFTSIYRRHHLLNNILLIIYGSCSSAPGNIIYSRPVKKQPWLYQMCKRTWYTARYTYTAERGHINTGEICKTVPTGYAISAIKAKKHFCGSWMTNSHMFYYCLIWYKEAGLNMFCKDSISAFVQAEYVTIFNVFLCLQGNPFPNESMECKIPPFWLCLVLRLDAFSEYDILESIKVWKIMYVLLMLLIKHMWQKQKLCAVPCKILLCLSLLRSCCPYLLPWCGSFICALEGRFTIIGPSIWSPQGRWNKNLMHWLINWV